MHSIHDQSKWLGKTTHQSLFLSRGMGGHPGTEVASWGSAADFVSESRDGLEKFWNYRPVEVFFVP